MDKETKLEIDALKAQIQELIKEVGYFKAFVKSNYKDDHPGTVFMDELDENGKFPNT